MDFERIFTPIRLAGIELANRLVRSAAATNLGGPFLTDELIAFEVSHARGGVGLIILGDASVHPTCPAPLLAYDDAIVDGYQRLMEAIRPYGTRIFQQLWHCGACYPNLDGTPPWSCSPIPSPTLGIVPHEMRIDEIEELIDGFAQSARRCVAGGLDGVELHGGHGYIFQQFLSPLSNTRTDRYGGSLVNRMRFTVEVLTAVRDSVGRGFPVGMRLSSQGFAGGLSGEDLAEIIGVLESGDLLDFVNFSVGSYAALGKVLGGPFEQPGYQLAPNQPALERTHVPRIVNGRFGSIAQAEAVLAAGQAELVGMTRALIADPDLPRKTRGGTSLHVRPCIACNDGCIGGLAVGAMSCSVNPAAGQEHRLADGLGRAPMPRRVLVAGGGPAGLEAARVAAERGHHVIVAEAEDHLGGQLAFARKAPGYELLGEFADWQSREMERLGVEIRLGLRADHTLAERLGADILIVATGSQPRLDGVHYEAPGRPATGVDNVHVISSWTALAEPIGDFDEEIVISDDTGHHEAVAVALHFVRSGRAVTFVTPHAQFAPGLAASLAAAPALDRLRRGDFRLHTRAVVREITAETVTIEPLDGGPPERQRAGLVVLVSPNRPVGLPGLGHGAGRLSAHAIGDASSPRFLGAAIAEGFRLGLTL